MVFVKFKEIAMVGRMVHSLLLTALLCPIVRADTYWVAYEGNDFPENEGWLRTYGDGTFPPTDQPDRWLENGELIISTARDPSLWEYYSRILLDPEVGETFEAEWRVRTEILSGPHDNGVVFARWDPPGHVSFRLRPDGLLVATDDVVIPLDETVYHDFRFASADMSSYSLWIDGMEVYDGVFDNNSLLHGYTAFGAGTQGASSISHWDHFRYGVVPEPATAVAYVSGLVLLGGARGRAAA
jgi:hypothetical protein